MSGSGRWHRHPGVRSGAQLSLGERAADRLRNGMGSWAFVFAALAFLAGWMGWNRHAGFDPYPFILLNLVLSCLAALQGAILLIAAKRSDQISSELAQHDYDTDVASRQLLEALQADFAVLQRQHADQGAQLARALRMLEAITPKATGGPVDPGTVCLVGEHGCELPMPPGGPDAPRVG